MEDGHSEVYDRFVRRRGTNQTSHCSVMEAFLDECEPEEVDRNHPMTTHHRGAEEARLAHNQKDG